MNTLHRGFWLIIGLIFVGLGTIGAILPIMPTVPFLLVSAFAFARSSQRFHQWLVEHPVVGPPIVDWQRSGAISRRVKWIASLSMAAGIVISTVSHLGWKIICVQLVTITIATIFIWSRPDN